MLGTHCVKHCCNLLSQIGLSSAENEYYAICGTSATGMGLQALLHDWNISMELKVLTDSSSAKAFASRRGLGRMKHIQTRFLWIQERGSGSGSPSKGLNLNQNQHPTHTEND